MREPETVMPEETAGVFRRLREETLLAPFILIGGTALALRIGHRKSEDLDFVTVLPKLPGAALAQVWRNLEELGFKLEHNDDPAAYDEFLNAGMDIKDYSQDWLINGTVKITFFSGESYHERILEHGNRTDASARKGFRVATLEEIARLKAIVAASRSKSRDWLDLYILEKNHGFGLANWKEAYAEAGLNDTQFETALKRICSGILTRDEGFTTLLPDPPSVTEIAEHFRKLRKEYESGLASKRIGGD